MKKFNIIRENYVLVNTGTGTVFIDFCSCRSWPEPPKVGWLLSPQHVFLPLLEYTVENVFLSIQVNFFFTWTHLEIGRLAVAHPECLGGGVHTDEQQVRSPEQHGDQFCLAWDPSSKHQLIMVPPVVNKMLLRIFLTRLNLPFNILFYFLQYKKK